MVIPMTPDQRAFAAQVDRWLKRSWLSATKVAARLRTSDTMLSFVRHGKRPPSAALKAKLLKLMGL
jgi:hypothetical protein